MAADVQMENLRRLHGQVLRRLSNMKTDFVTCLKEHETKLVTAFRVKLYDVKHETETKKLEVIIIPLS